MMNKTVSELLYKIADLLDIRGDNFFKTRAYRIAAQTIEVLDEDISDVVKEKRVQDIPGIGRALSEKIKEFVETGRLEYFEKLKKEIPGGLLDLLDIPSLGPKKVSALYNKLGIKDVDQLRDACENGRLRDLDGFGEITERNILRGILLKEKTSGRFLLNVAYEDGNKYLYYLKKNKNIKRISLAGSLRRMKETVGDLDILVSSKNADDIMDFFVDYVDVQRVLMKGPTKSSVLLNSNIQVDLRVVDDKSFGAALQYFTGSKEHNVKMRSLAIKQGFKLNEYGLFDKETEKYVVGKDEKEVYEKLGLVFIEPELRENTGEVESASKKDLPDLVKIDDIVGDLHVHSLMSDGSNTIEEIVENAKKLGYNYVGVTDHSQSLHVAKGLSIEKVKKKIKKIKDLNKKFDDFEILCGTECDIKSDGSLDYPDSVLKLFDFVGIAIHMGFKMTREEATRRITKGLENEYVTFLAHPTGRLIGRREPFDLDTEQIFRTAAENNVYMEINSFPDRLDLNYLHIKQAKDLGCKFIIGTDAHNIDHMSYMRFGVATARRGWLEKNDILNTYTLNTLRKKM